MTLWLVMIAGGLGSGLRYLVAQWVGNSPGSVPYGTLTVNLVGCFILGMVVQLSASGNWSPELRTTVAVGLLGGFTTYSSFNHETITLLTSGAFVTAAAYVVITLVGGLAGGSLGLAVARLIQS